MTQLSKSLFDGTSHESRGEQHSPSATDPPEHQHAYKGGKQCKQTSQKQQGGSANANGPSRKRLSLEDEERDDDDLKEPPRKQLKDHKADKPCKSLACPYHQRNSQNLQLNSSCREPGFPDIARLKEHLYRVHHIHPCDRCGEIFASIELRAAHMRAPASQICNTEDWRAIYDRDRGFEDAQKDSIQRKSVRTWNSIYKILFPEDPEGEYPPQYYCDAQLVRFLDRFRAHYQQHTQELVPQRLANAGFLTTLNGPQRENVRNGILAFVNNLHSEIVQAFRTDVLQEANVSAHGGTLAQPINVPPPEVTWAEYINDIDPTLNFSGPEPDWTSLYPGSRSAEVQMPTGLGTEHFGFAPNLPSMGPQITTTHTPQLSEQQLAGASALGYTGAVVDGDGWSFIEGGSEELDQDRSC